MTEDNQDRDPLLMDHDSDGIRELDNNLPRWWVWLFYLTIIFAVVYMCYYHVFRVGDSPGRRIREGMEAGRGHQGRRAGAIRSLHGHAHAFQGPAMLAEGKDIFLDLLRALPSRGRRRPRRTEFVR